MTSQPGPAHQAAENMERLASAQQAGYSWGNGTTQQQGRQQARQAREQRRQARQQPTVNKTRVGGGFNPSVNPAVSINITKGGGQPGPGPQGAAPAAGRSTPGSDFNSNEDIRAFSEAIRKAARQRAVERSMDAEQLEGVLRHIPDSNGTMAGAMMRARRVSRHLKKIAKAEQAIGKAAAQLYAQFEREYEAELRKVGRGRPQQQPRNFGWH